MSVRRALLPLAAAAALALTGCGGDDPAPTTPGSTVAGSSADSSLSDPSSGAGSSGSDDTSGTSISDAAGAIPKLVDEADANAATMMLKDGAFTPATATVGAGSTVTFAVGDADLHDIVVGDQGSVTGSRNVPRVFFFTDAGRYVISDEITGATATVVVE